MARLSTAQRIVIGFAIAPLVLTGLVFYALHDLATLKEQVAAAGAGDDASATPAPAEATPTP